MKLHLPKALLTAVLAVCVAQDAWADWAPNDKYSDTANGKIVFYTTADLTVVDKFNPSTGNEIATSCTNIWIAPESNNQEHVFTNVYIADDDTLSIVRNPWGASDNAPIRDFKSLTIESLKIGDGTGAATLIVNTNQNLTLNAVEGSFSSVTAQGSIEFTDSSSIGTLGMKDGGVVNFTGGTHTVEKMDIHNNNPSAGSNETLTISGAAVKITGSDITDTNGVEDIYGGSTGTAAVTIGHWNNGGGKIVVGGETASASLFDVSGATIRMSWDSGSTLEIKENGTVNAKRIQFANDNGDNAVITLAGGRLNLGEGGISANSHNNAYTGTSKREINLNSGTLGALAESVDIAAGTTNIGGAITIDTAIVDAEGEKTGETANISFSNNVVLSDDAAFTVKGGGAVSFNALNVGKTLLFDVQDNTQVDITGVSINTDNGDLKLDVIEAKYSDNSAGTLTSNGFRKGEFLLFDGYEWNESIAGYEVSVRDGDTYVTTDNVGATYYVNEGTHTISTAGDYINDRALGYSVAKNAGLVIDGASSNLSAADMLTGTTGEGNITVSTDVTLTPGASTQATGNLTVQNAKITLDTTGDHNQIKVKETSMSSFSSVTLDNATLEYVGATTSLNNVTVTSNGANLKFRDMAAAESEYQLKGTTTLNGDLTVGRMDGNQAWKYILNIEALTGDGDLSFTSAHETGKLNISSMQGYTGAITVTKGANGAATLNATTGGAVNLTGITLAGGATGTLAVSGAANLGDVNIGAGSLSISNTGTTTATTTLKTLQGSGSLSFTGNEAERTLVISSLQGYTGSLTVTKGTGATFLAATANGDNNGLVNLKGVTLSNGANGWIKVKNTDTSNTSSLGAVSLSGGSDLRIWNVGKTGITNISSLTVSGSATLGTYRDGTSYQGTVNIASLSSQGESAELTLKNASQTDDATVINLNGGTFTGTIKLESDSHRGNGEDNRSRDLQVNLKNVNVAAGSIIAFQNPSTADGSTHDRSNFITLGVGVEGAKVAGLTGTTTNAATIKATEGTKSLEIITADGADYSTNAKVESSVNLVKSGEGKQTISGAVSTTGSVKVNDGELALTGTSALSLNQLSLFDTTNATGGTLSVGGANGGTVNIVSAGSVVVGKDSVLNGNLTLGAGTALTLNGYGDNAATINGTLTLGTGMQVSGLEQLLNDLAAQEAGADGLKSLKLFNVTTVDFGTVEATLAMAADALEEEQPLIAGYDASKYFSSLDVGAYALIFQNSALYLQTTAPIPEPTTATLSLLALTALAARRRRK